VGCEPRGTSGTLTSNISDKNRIVLREEGEEKAIEKGCSSQKRPPDISYPFTLSAIAIQCALHKVFLSGNLLHDEVVTVMCLARFFNVRSSLWSDTKNVIWCIYEPNRFGVARTEGLCERDEPKPRKERTLLNGDTKPIHVREIRLGGR
jgi:hypothetical protein